MGKKGSGFGKLVIGAGLGAALGLLFAPKSGEETRKDIKKKADELTKKVKEVDLNEVKDELFNEFRELKEEIKNLDMDQAKIIAKDKGDELLEKVQELIEMAKEKGTPIVENSAKELKKRVADYLQNLSNKLSK
jgi:gas vesicle protein